MKVIVLEHRWDTPDNEGSDIQIYREDNADAARMAMRASANLIREEFRKMWDEDPWESDYTWEEEDEIHMGFCPKVPFPYATVYAWEIYEREVM